MTCHQFTSADRQMFDRLTQQCLGGPTIEVVKTHLGDSLYQRLVQPTDHPIVPWSLTPLQLHLAGKKEMLLLLPWLSGRMRRTFHRFLDCPVASWAFSFGNKKASREIIQSLYCLLFLPVDDDTDLGVRAGLHRLGRACCDEPMGAINRRLVDLPLAYRRHVKNVWEKLNQIRQCQKEAKDLRKEFSFEEQK